MHTPAFASYTGPSIKWVKRLAFDKAGGQEITSTLHVSTHLDAPAHFQSGGKFIGDFPLDWLIGPACVVDLLRSGIGDFDIYGPEHFEQWEKDTGHSIDKGDIVLIHTGYHRYYPENWMDRSEVDETRYFIRHPGPRRRSVPWMRSSPRPTTRSCIPIRSPMTSCISRTSGARSTRSSIRRSGSAASRGVSRAARQRSAGRSPGSTETEADSERGTIGP